MKKIIWLANLLILFLIGCEESPNSSLEKFFSSQVIAEAKTRCVTLWIKSSEDEGLGSGVLIDSCRILTAKHCVKGDFGFYQIQIIWRNQHFPVKVSYLFPDMDLALLEVINYKFPVSQIIPNDSFYIGLAVSGFNSTSQEEIVPYEGTIVDTVLAEPLSTWHRFITRFFYNYDPGKWWPCQGKYLLIDGRFFVIGMSGGAVYDLEGRLVGILVGRTTLLNFYRKGKVIPVTHFKEILK